MALHVCRIDGMPLYAAVAVEATQATASSSGVNIDEQFTTINNNVSALQGKTTEMTETEVDDLLGALS